MTRVGAGNRKKGPPSDFSTSQTEQVIKIPLIGAVCAALLAPATPVQAQALGPQVKNVRDGTYVYAAKGADANVSIILTGEGAVMVDTGQSPADSHAAMGIVKKLTSQPVRFIIHTEPHADHTVGDFVFAPPAVVITHAGAADSMKKAAIAVSQRNETFAAEYPGARDALIGYKQVLPHVEYRQKMTLNAGERNFELI